MPQNRKKASNWSLFPLLCHQTGHDIQQAEENSSRPTVPADSSLREDEGFSPNGAGVEFWW